MLRKLIMAATVIGGLVYFFKKNKHTSTKERVGELSGKYHE